MKNQVKFEIFEENQTIYFDIMRLAELESALGMTIVDVVRKQDAGISFALTALQIGMKHHYFKATKEFYAEKLGDYFDNGGSLDDVLMPIIKAIFVSGIFGKEVKEKMNEIALQEDEKNV